MGVEVNISLMLFGLGHTHRSDLSGPFLKLWNCCIYKDPASTSRTRSRRTNSGVCQIACSSAKTSRAGERKRSARAGPKNSNCVSVLRSSSISASASCPWANDGVVSCNQRKRFLVQPRRALGLRAGQRDPGLERRPAVDVARRGLPGDSRQCLFEPGHAFSLEFRVPRRPLGTGAVHPCRVDARLTVALENTSRVV